MHTPIYIYIGVCVCEPQAMGWYYVSLLVGWMLAFIGGGVKPPPVSLGVESTLRSGSLFVVAARGCPC